MTVRVPLGDRFDGEPFPVDKALRAGLTRGRLEGADLMQPFWGVRMRARENPTVADLARAYATRMPHDSFFSHTTAAQLWSIPLPLPLRHALPLHVSGPDNRRAAHGQGVAGHRLHVDARDLRRYRGLPVTSLERTLCDLGSLLNDEDWLAAGDNILWRRRPRQLRATRESLDATIVRWAGRRGRPRVQELSRFLTDLSDSPPESAFRLRFARAGLPATLANAEIYDARGQFLAQPDLQFTDFRMAQDYEGDHHRTDKKQWRKDLARAPRLEDAGWHYTRMSAADLEDSTELIARLIRILRTRGWDG